MRVFNREFIKFMNDLILGRLFNTQEVEKRHSQGYLWFYGQSVGLLIKSH